MINNSELLIRENGRVKLVDSLSFFTLLFVCGGIYGFVYEVIDCKIEIGYFINRGSTFGPWIPIYAFGGTLIYLFSNRLRSKPWLVFLVDCIVTGTLEYVTGYVLLKKFNIRLWDYTNLKWNWGCINGFVCARSVLFFGVSGLILVFLVAPAIKKLLDSKFEKITWIISFLLFILFVLDIIIFQLMS